MPRNNGLMPTPSMRGSDRAKQGPSRADAPTSTTVQLGCPQCQRVMKLSLPAGVYVCRNRSEATGSYTGRCSGCNASLKIPTTRGA